MEVDSLIPHPIADKMVAGAMHAILLGSCPTAKDKIMRKTNNGV